MSFVVNRILQCAWRRIRNYWKPNAMVDAARLADELRCEQDIAMCLEKDKKLLE